MKVDIGRGLRVDERSCCRSCGAGVQSLRFYDGMLGFEAIECKVCGHQEDLNDPARRPETFFTQSRCDRCGGVLDGGRTMSWFTKDCLCPDCHHKERELRVKLRRAGQDDAKLEACGYVPASTLR